MQALEFSGLGLRLLAAASILFVVSCGETALTVAHDRNGTQPMALGSTADAFIGKPRRAGAAGFGGFNAIDATLFEPGNTTPYSVTDNLSLGISHQINRPISDDVSGYGRLTLAVGKTRYHLPQGMGVFTDPTALEFTTLTVEPEVGLQKTWHARAMNRPYAMSASLGVGLEAAAVSTSVQSALLDVRHGSQHAIPYVAAGMEWQSPNAALRAGAQARLRADGTAQLRADLHLPLAR